jgi:OOP family OmpA-OmpF porin
MKDKLPTIIMGLIGLVSAMALAASVVQADTRGQASGYLVDSSGNVVRSGGGDCWHDSSWSPDKATIVGCDGVVLDAQVEVIKGQGTGLVAAVSIPAATLFAFDSDVLSEAGKQAIEEYRKTLKPELAEAYAGVVVGHTDSTGDANYNLDLSKRRANNVRQYLVSTGVAEEKLRILGRGAKDPIASNETSEGRAQNRRVELVVIGEVRALDAFRFPSVALFPRRSAELTPMGEELLEKNRQDARDQLRRATYIEIVGHTDDVGDDDYNLNLSLQRAEAVRDYLVSEGVDASKIATVGMGESMPIASNSTPEGRAENRRVEILVLGRMK